MAADPQAAQLMLQIDAGPGADPEELDALTRRLRDEIGQLDVDSVELTRSEERPEGAKFIDPVTLGGIAVSLAPSVVPKLFDLLQFWMGRNRSRSIKIKTQIGDRTVEFEYSPKLTSPADLNQILTLLTGGLAAASQAGIAPPTVQEPPAAQAPPRVEPTATVQPSPRAEAPPPIQMPPPVQPAPATTPPVPIDADETITPTGKKLALIIGNSEYQDPKLAQLVTPDADVKELAAVLSDREVGGFDQVKTLVNETLFNIQREIARFFAQKSPDDLLLLYFSGHGVRDDQGCLYLATKDTDNEVLSGTSIPATFITGEMDRSRSRRQVLVLDCCHSGAFAQGAKGVPGGSVGTGATFEGKGFGRIVLTATDATQYAWEGDRIVGEAQTSVFTKFLIQGLKTGAADTETDGLITIDELYDYVYQQVVNTTPKQVPGKWSYREQGELVIARNPHPVFKPAELPRELQQAIESPFASVREAAVHELEHLLRGSDRNRAVAAENTLHSLTQDDSRRVASAAAQILSAYTGQVAQEQMTGSPPQPTTQMVEEPPHAQPAAAAIWEQHAPERDRAMVEPFAPTEAPHQTAPSVAATSQVVPPDTGRAPEHHAEQAAAVPQSVHREPEQQQPSFALFVRASDALGRKQWAEAVELFQELNAQDPSFSTQVAPLLAEAQAQLEKSHTAHVAASATVPTTAPSARPSQDDPFLPASALAYRFGVTLAALRRVALSIPSPSVFEREKYSVDLTSAVILMLMAGIVAGLIGRPDEIAILTGLFFAFVGWLGWTAIWFVLALPFTRKNRFRIQLYLNALILAPYLSLLPVLYRFDGLGNLAILLLSVYMIFLTLLATLAAYTP